MIKIPCEKCCQNLEIEERFAGLLGSCPGCGADILIPAASDFKGRIVDEQPPQTTPPQSTARPASRSPATTADSDAYGAMRFNCKALL